MRITPLRSLVALLMLGGCMAAAAQGYYDDDIYFDPKKDKDKNIEAARQLKQERANAVILRPVADYPAADTYEVTGTSSRDVDEYNRRGVFARQDSLRASRADSLGSDFAYTRRIERYYNPAIVASSTDPELAQLYYAEPANVNIIINSPSWGYWGPSWAGWYDPWYAYNPWWGSYWGPAWAWGPGWGWGPSWAWGPSWSWAWGPSWSWTWGPGWGWGPSWGPGWGPGWGWSWGWSGPARPYNPRHPGAVRRPSQAAGHAPGYNNGGWRRPTQGGSYRRPSQGGSYRPSGSGTRPGNSGNSGNYNNYTRPGRSGGYRSSGNSSGSYRSSGNSSGSYRSSGTSSGGGSYRSSGGGSRSGGGGGGRGRH